MGLVGHLPLQGVCSAALHSLKCVGNSHTAIHDLAGLICNFADYLAMHATPLSCYTTHRCMHTKIPIHYQES
jgi:hypothetical protein